MKNTKETNPKYGKGKSSWNAGKKLSEKHKENIRKGIKNVKIWNKDKKHSPETIQKMKDGMKGKNKGKFLNAKNPVWKGDKAKPQAMHRWVERRKGKARYHLCQHCGKVRAKHWANINHSYRRKLDDYAALCVKCHSTYDKARKDDTALCVKCHSTYDKARKADTAYQGPQVLWLNLFTEV